MRYVPSKGNLGDALIAATTGQVFGGMRIHDTPDAPVVFVSGGGGFVSHYRSHCVVRALARVPRNLRVVVGPSTVNDHWPLFRSFPNLVLMARDEMTLRLARMNRVPCLFSHDIAFDYFYPDTAATAEKLVAIRQDDERAIEAPPGSKDVSAIQPNRRWDLRGSDTAASQFVREVARHRAVDTNRLHVAIVAACMGRGVTMRANSYFKNRAVFESSLSKLPGVIWS